MEILTTRSTKWTFWKRKKWNKKGEKNIQRHQREPQEMRERVDWHWQWEVRKGGIKVRKKLGNFFWIECKFKLFFFLHLEIFDFSPIRIFSANSSEFSRVPSRFCIWEMFMFLLGGPKFALRPCVCLLVRLSVCLSAGPSVCSYSSVYVRLLVCHSPWVLGKIRLLLRAPYSSVIFPQFVFWVGP